MEKHLRNAAVYQEENRHPRIRSNFPWIIILVQFIIIICLIVAFFAYFITRPITENRLTTRTYENFELQTISPSSVPLTFRRRFKSTSTSYPQSIDIDFSENFATSRKSVEPTTTTNIAKIAIEEVNSVENFEHENFRAAVLSEHAACSEMGRSILVRGGNAVDAAIAVSFCLMGAQPHKASLAGGMMMLIRTPNGTITTINARESTPMLVDKEEIRQNPKLVEVGKKSIGVPGTINGLYRAFEKHASRRIEWKKLIFPTVQHCSKEGFEIDSEFRAILKSEPKIDFKKTIIRNNKINCSALGYTLSEILEFEDPIEGFYKGEIARKMIEELNGYLSFSDFEDYESDIQTAICTKMDDNTKICGPNPPSLFAVLANTYIHTKNMSSLQKVNDFVKSNFRLASTLGDPVFQKTSNKVASDMAKGAKKDVNEEITVNFDEAGATSIFIIDENNATVSITLSLGDVFGSRVFSKMGFFYNNNLRYFDLKNDDGNLSIQPGKLANTKISPVVVLRNNEILSVTGGSDFLGIIHLLRDISHRNYDVSRRSPALFIQNSAIFSKNSQSSLKYYLTGY